MRPAAAPRKSHRLPVWLKVGASSSRLLSLLQRYSPRRLLTISIEIRRPTEHVYGILDEFYRRRTLESRSDTTPWLNDYRNEERFRRGRFGFYLSPTFLLAHLASERVNRSVPADLSPFSSWIILNANSIEEIIRFRRSSGKTAEFIIDDRFLVAI